MAECGLPRTLLRHTPNTGFVGTDTFTYQVTDRLLTSSVQSVTISVTAVAPLTASAASYSVQHDTMLIVSAAPTGPAGSVPILPGLPGGGGQGLLANVVNPSGVPLKALLVAGPEMGACL